jgi:hypothetical protein
MREENKATEELLSIPDFEVAFAQAQAEVTDNNLVSFNSIRRNV